MKAARDLIVMVDTLAKWIVVEWIAIEWIAIEWIAAEWMAVAVDTSERQIEVE